jgi:hypothetical protein
MNEKYFETKMFQNKRSQDTTTGKWISQALLSVVFLPVQKTKIIKKLYAIIIQVYFQNSQ